MINRTRALAVTFAAVAVVLVGATPAFAHTAHISATLTCDAQGRQVVTWFNRGGSPSFGVATITASDRAAVATGQKIPASPTITKVGTETFPASATQNITLREAWLWGDGNTDTDHYTVTLGIDCTQPTSSTPPPTTTTPPPTTTTPPPTSSSTPPSGTGSSTSSTSTGPPSATSGSTRPGGTPFTGMSSTPLIALGALLVLGLGALALSRKKVDEV